MTSCFKSGNFLFFLNYTVCVLQNSVTFRLLEGGKLKLKLQRAVLFWVWFFFWVKNRVPVYVIVRAWIECMLLTWRNTNKYLQMENTSSVFCFQIESPHILSSVVFLLMHWTLICGPWEEHCLFLYQIPCFHQLLQSYHVWIMQILVCKEDSAWQILSILWSSKFTGAMPCPSES